MWPNRPRSLSGEHSAGKDKMNHSMPGALPSNVLTYCNDTDIYASAVRRVLQSRVVSSARGWPRWDLFTRPRARLMVAEALSVGVPLSLRSLLLRFQWSSDVVHTFDIKAATGALARCTSTRSVIVQTEGMSSPSLLNASLLIYLSEPYLAIVRRFAIPADLQNKLMNSCICWKG